MRDWVGISVAGMRDIVVFTSKKDVKSDLKGAISRYFEGNPEILF